MEPIIDPYKKVCKYHGCKKAFDAKRLNQEYCGYGCKKKCNNGKAAAFRKVAKAIDAQLKKNHQVLEGFYNAAKVFVGAQDLAALGFDYSRPTSLERCPKTGDTFPSFYNYSLQEIEKNKFKITKTW
jgi:hypothetical protein